MSNLHEGELSKWYESLDEARADGFAPVKCTSLVQFYRLEGRKSIISRDNFTPIVYLQYVYLSPVENRYYLKTFPGFDFNECYYFNAHYDVFGRNLSIRQLRERVLSGYGVWLLFNKHQISEMSSMLERIWNANRSDKGKLGYQDYLTLVELTLRKNEFVETQRGVVGFRSVINGMDEQIKALWKNAKNQLK